VDTISRVRLLLDERVRADGGLARTYLDADGVVYDDDRALARLPIVAIESVMRRYGRPLEDGVVPEGDELALPGSRAIRRLRFHAIVDAEARDYLVFRSGSEEPLAVLATMATAAIRHLAARLPQIPEGSGGGG
jgi:hypothetical protein